MLSKTIVPTSRSAVNVGGSGVIDDIARKLVWAGLKRIAEGGLELVDREHHLRCGDRNAVEESTALIRVIDPRFYRAVAWGGTVGAGEAYIRGWWDCADLTTLIRILIRNHDAFSELNGTRTRLSGLAQRAWHAFRRNTLKGSRQNISAHYDLSNDFYQLFLDKTMTYSCGIFESQESTLQEASVAKLDRICRKLGLTADDHVIEIGTGWGSFAIHAAKNYGCRVTTTTISEKQFELACRRIDDAGLSDRITLLRTDYRKLTGQYAKLVSIEMIEAIGWQQYPNFFKQCAALLKPDGVACIQAITKADRYYEESKREVDFIKRYIFPGSCIPSIGSMTDAVAKASDLTLGHMEDITPHYATTLRCWRNRFDDRLPEVRSLGFPESFIRMWEYYLCYCEAGFHERVIGDVQMVLTKPRFSGALPMGGL